MRTAICGMLVLVVVLDGAVARAQRLPTVTPAAGMNAVSATAGVAVPNEELLGAGPAITVAGEHYLSARLSVRGALGAAFWHFADFPDDTARPVFFLGSIVYNRSVGAFRPFVVVGLGVYAFRFTEAGLDSSVGKTGLHAGIGTEYLITRRTSLTAEVLLHPVAREAAGRLADYETSFWSLSAGYKKYF